MRERFPSKGTGGEGEEERSWGKIEGNRFLRERKNGLKGGLELAKGAKVRPQLQAKSKVGGGKKPRSRRPTKLKKLPEKRKKSKVATTSS